MNLPTIEYRVCRPQDPDIGAQVSLVSHTMPVIACSFDSIDYWLLVDEQGLVWFAAVPTDGDIAMHNITDYAKVLDECCEHHL